MFTLPVHSLDVLPGISAREGDRGLSRDVRGAPGASPPRRGSSRGPRPEDPPPLINEI